jgi:hypothetical protein
MTISFVPEGLLEYANATQVRYLNAVNETGSLLAAGKLLGVAEASVRRAYHAVKDKASVQGFAPGHPGWVRPVPRTHVAQGVSVYHPAVKDAAGNVTEPAAWVKANLRKAAHDEMVRDAMRAFVEELPRLELPPAADRDYSTDVIPWIQIGDAHIGMLAHAAEVGENFDVKIAEREICGAMAQLIDEMPYCERVVISDLGDFTHYENFTATTEASGHALDFDSRFPKMIKAYSRIMRFIVERALTKAKIVDVMINQGNHSRTNDIWMAVLLKAVYEGNERVNVLDNDSVFIGYRMGKTLVMVHHSDKCPPARLRTVMTTDYRRDFGETDFHYIDIGHVHHRSVAVDEGGIVIESWNHLAASDKWAHEAGYRSSKSISVVLRSKTYGEIGRRTLGIAEVRDRLYGPGHNTQLKKPAFVAT